MLNVILSRSAEIQLSTLKDKDRQQVLKWCDRLKGWRKDRWLGRIHRINLGHNGRETVYHLRTDSEIRLFFKFDEKKGTITINDIFFRRAIDQLARTFRHAAT